jgi:DNA-binding MarR family transcriptional regulator
MSKVNKKSSKAAQSKKARKETGEGQYTVRSISFGGQTYKYNDVTKVHPALKTFFCYGINKVAYKKKLELEKALVPLGVHAIHVGVLRLVDMAENISQNEISDSVGLDKATMVKVVDHLQGMKLVERKQSRVDRRVNFITITAKGKKFLAQAVKVSEGVEEKFLSGLTAEETKALKAIITKLLG